MPSLKHACKPKVEPEAKELRFHERLLKCFTESPADNFTIDEVNKIVMKFVKTESDSRKNKTDEMPFGKYRFKKVKDVAKFDKQYLIWLRKQSMMENYGDLMIEITKHV